MNILESSIPKLASLLRRKELSSRELVGFYLERIKDNVNLNSYITVIEDAKKLAEDVDKDGIRDDDHILKGIPFSLKDNFLTKGIKTTCASKILSNYIATYNSTVFERLKEHGTVLLGKTNMDEFAMGSSNENSFFGVVGNPWDKERVPGGSSGGSAVSVSAGLTPISFGTDTGGSVRLPAAYTGVLALKPTYGRISRYGIVAFGSSLDQVGPMARNVEDLAIAYDSVAGKDPRDSTTSDREASSIYNYLLKNVIGKEKKVSKKCIGIPRDIIKDGINKEILASMNDVIDTLSHLGFSFKDIELPYSKYALDAYYIIATGEASSNLSRYDGVRYGSRTEDYNNLVDLYKSSRGDGFGDEVKRRIMLGTFALSAGYFDAYFAKAAKVRALIRRDFERVYESCDLILMPTSPTTAFKIGEKIDDPLTMYLSDILTISVNLAAVPALAFPSGFDSIGLPIGMQLIGRHFEEEVLFSTAWIIQKEKGEWFNNIP